MGRKARFALPAALAVIAGALFLSLRGPEVGDASGGAFRYDIDEYRRKGPLPAGWREVLSVPLDGESLGGLAVDGEGRTCIALDDRLIFVDEGGGRTGEIELPGPAGAVAFGGGGRIYAAMGDRIAAITPDGTIAEWSSLGEKSVVTSLAAGRGAVFAADAGNRIVWRFDGEGRLLGTFGRRDLGSGELGFIVPSPYFDLALGRNGELWVVNPGRLRVERHEGDGRLSAHWGIPSLAAEGFGGCCNPSHIAILPDGSFVTSEKGLPRVKVYGPGGSLRSVVAGPESFRPGTVDLDLAVTPSGRILVLDPARRSLRVFERTAEGQGGGGDGA